MTVADAPAHARSLSQTGLSEIRRALGDEGIGIDLGAFAVRVRSPLHGLAAALQAVYPDFPFDAAPASFDATIDLRPVPGYRRWLRPQATIEVDGIDPFGAFPRAQLLPYFEWGVNWACANMLNAHLMLHSGAIEWKGSGMLLVATPGSGKSTLTAALVARGARLLSDEFGIVRIPDLRLLAMAKPIALKNQAIDVIRQWWPDARLGPRYLNTRKGELSHCAVPLPSVADRGRPVDPRVIVFPRWSPGAALSLTQVAAARAFLELAANSFNYSTLGPTGFDAVERLLGQCRCYHLEYGDLERCVEVIGRLCEGVEVVGESDAVPPSFGGLTAEAVVHGDGISDGAWLSGDADRETGEATRELAVGTVRDGDSRDGEPTR